MSPRIVKIGICYEGNRDIEPILIIISRILQSIGYQFVIQRKISPRTGLLGLIKTYTKLFFESKSPVELGIYLTDQDKQEKNVKNRVAHEIAKVNPTYLEFSVIGIPRPHFESWLIKDEGTVKKCLRLNPADPLPKKKLAPKDRLEYLQKNMSRPQTPLFQVYNDLATMMSISFVRRNSTDFNNFCNDLISCCKKIR